MSVLTERKTWKRKPSPTAPPRELPRLTLDQRANVRRVLDFLTVVFGSPRALANAMGMTEAGLRKVRQPSRSPTRRTAILAAYVAGVTAEDVLAGRWQRHTCPACGHVGPHDAVTR